MNVLLSSAGRRVSLLRIFQNAIKRSGKRGGVFAADISSSTPGAALADRYFEVPRCDEAHYIPTLLEICRRANVGLVLPTIDTELPHLAAAHEDFSRIGVSLAVSDPATIALCADKAATHDWLKAQGLPVPSQAHIEAGGSIPDDLKLDAPLIAKPRYGSSSVGVRVLDDAATATAFTARADTVVEDLLKGEEYTVNVYVDRAGRARCAVPHRRIAVRGGEVSRAVTVRNEDVIRLASSVAEKLSGAYGPVNVQIFACTDGTVRVTEINPRFSGGYPLAERAGARFADWLIEEANGESLSASPTDWQDGVSMSRFDTEVFFDRNGEVMAETAEQAEGFSA